MHILHPLSVVGLFRVWKPTSTLRLILLPLSHTHTHTVHSFHVCWMSISTVSFWLYVFRMRKKQKKKFVVFGKNEMKKAHTEREPEKKEVEIRSNQHPSVKRTRNEIYLLCVYSWQTRRYKAHTISKSSAKCIRKIKLWFSLGLLSIMKKREILGKNWLEKPLTKVDWKIIHALVVHRNV